jgi:hypothetical protein
MSWNFDDDWVYVPRNKFREKAVTPEPERKTATAEASTVPPAEEWARIKSMLFRVLKGFPEAFDAVVEGLRQLQVELQQQPVPTPIRC